MAGVTAGEISQVSVAQRQAVLSCTDAVNGSTPYSYQWYRSTTTGFTPGGGNILSGETSLSLTDTGLVPGTTYYYKLVVIDSAATPTSSTATQLAVTTSAVSPNPNQFVQSVFLGVLDEHFNGNVIPVQFDPDGSGTLKAGQALKWVDTASGVPLVAPSTARADVVCGFVAFNVKDVEYDPGDMLEMASDGCVQYLVATAAISRGAKVLSYVADVAGGCLGGIAPVTGSSGYPIVGYALDKAVAGDVFRVFLQCMSGQVDS